jgi:hypothetical protein
MLGVENAENITAIILFFAICLVNESDENGNWDVGRRGNKEQRE